VLVTSDDAVGVAAPGVVSEGGVLVAAGLVGLGVAVAVPLVGGGVGLPPTGVAVRSPAGKVAVAVADGVNVGIVVNVADAVGVGTS
jgi:hypothetical protein